MNFFGDTMPSLLYIWLVLNALLGLFYLILSSLRHHMHMMQQNGYRADRYRKWYADRCGKELRKGELILLLPCVLLLWEATAGAAFYVIAPLFLLFLALLYFPHPAKEKKPLVFTKRAIRLYFTASVTAAIPVGALLFLSCLTKEPIILIAGLFVLFIFSPFLMLAGAAITAPIEKRINDGFLNEAREKLLAMKDLRKVGITGSYGKTSTKMILAAVLGEKYDTLATPGSFNTPMGVTRVVREQLSPIHQIFLCEMGAKQKGDIAELCELAHPTIGVLTAIGQQHLETFGSQQAIIDTKFELLESLPKDGLAIVNGDEPMITENLHRCPCRVLRYGLGAENQHRAEDISYGPAGTEFTYCCGDIRESFRTPLLGRHMVINILAALALGSELGVDMNKMKRAIRRLPSIEHRLQLRSAGSYNIIDDAFNSNPAGAAAALEVLSSFRGGKKIVVTPGMVELGEQEHELNHRLGQQLAEVCDHIILVGKKHSLPLQEGVASADFPKERLYVAADLNDARAHLSRIVAAGDVVLFENDLPDTYNE